MKESLKGNCSFEKPDSHGSLTTVPQYYRPKFPYLPRKDLHEGWGGRGTYDEDSPEHSSTIHVQQQPANLTCMWHCKDQVFFRLF